MKNSWKAILAVGTTAGAAVGASSGILRAQSKRVRRAFRADAQRRKYPHAAVVSEDGSRGPLSAEDSGLPAVAVIGDSWLSGVGLEKAADHPAVRIARGFAALAQSPVRLRSLAVPAVGASAVASQVSELLADAAMERTPVGSQLRLAVISMGTADVVHPVKGTIGLPILTNAINRLQVEGHYRVLVLTTPNLGGLPGLRNPVRTVLRRSSRVLAGSQTVAALSTNAVPISLTNLLSGTSRVSLLAPEGRYPSRFGSAQIASGVITTAARVMEFPTAITQPSQPSSTPPAPTQALERQAAQAARNRAAEEAAGEEQESTV